MRILIIEDEIRLAEALKELLEKNKHSVDVSLNGQDGLNNALCGIYDAVILDIMLPKMSGTDVLREIRRENIKTPVLLLTAKSEVEDKIRGLDLGADDYLTKPFDTGELLARLRAVTRRKGEIVDNDPGYRGLSLLINKTELSYGGLSVKLGLKEYQIMELLLRNPRQIFTKEQIIVKIWGYDNDTEYNSVEVYVSFLRKKLDYIKSRVGIVTRRGIGYVLEEE